MSILIEQIIKQISTLPEDEQVELVEMIADEMAWRQSLKKSKSKLEVLALKANQEFLNGETDPLFPLD